MQRTFELELLRPPSSQVAGTRTANTGMFASGLLACACLSAILAGWLPIQFSIVTVFLFAGPHNWVEMQYFISRLPLRLGRSRRFFVFAFLGWSVLLASYAAIPATTRVFNWSTERWLFAIAVWNSALLLWIAALIWLRSKLRSRTNWLWVWPVGFALVAVNWLAPQFVSLSFVYIHPLIALVFLDRHLVKTRPEWVKTFRRCLLLLPLLLGVLWWRLAASAQLPEDGSITWRITTHAGADWLPNLSSHLLVSTHVFLETLHYAVWLIALPLIGRRWLPWDIKSVPLVKHRAGWPRVIRIAMIAGAAFVVLLWLGFSVDYATTRDIYFTIAMGHVIAEAPFLLRMI